MNRHTIMLWAASKLENRFKTWKFYTREICKLSPEGETSNGSAHLEDLDIDERLI
jgi:hypothetical protein